VQSRGAGAFGEDRDGCGRIALRAPARGPALSACPRAAVALACAAFVSVAACEAAEEKCEKARAQAAEAWDGYVAALEQARAQAAKDQSESHVLSSAIEARLSPAAQKIADGRYDRSSGAWARANEFALHDLCSKDNECRAQKERNVRAQAALRDLDERLALARAAAIAARDQSTDADSAAAAVIVHPEYPALKSAQQLGRSASELCAGLPRAR
jgi:hypothetical protein